ncbi:hypothetical protein EJB05_11517, partial [Eragrostis curvula]
MSFLLLIVAGTAARAAAQQASGVVATFNLYNPAQIDWDLGAAGAFCATFTVEACVVASIASQVTNEATGAQAVARVVDQCYNGGLDLDAAVFSQIDTDGVGMASGSLAVDYEFVECED